MFNSLVAECAKQRRVLALDWRGHGRSETPGNDFDASDLVKDAIAVIETSQAKAVVPIALSHAGWVAIELRRGLGAKIPKLVLLDWIILEAPPIFLEALRLLQDPVQSQQTRDHLFDMWLRGLVIAELTNYVRKDMGSYPAEMWARAAREIRSAYAVAGSPLQALADLDLPVPTLHIYA